MSLQTTSSTLPKRMDFSYEGLKTLQEKAEKYRLQYLTALATWAKLSGNHDDDWVDRLNHITTVVMLVVCGLFTAGGLYFGEHIYCDESGITSKTACRLPEKKMHNLKVRDIVASWVTWSKLTGNHDDDWADRLNHLYTVLMLIVFTMFVTAGTYFSETIICYRDEIPPIMHKYANYICWINNTYYVPMHGDLPSGPADRLETEIPYYQYVPIILLVMALLFKFPSVVWRSLSGYSGIDLNKIAELTATAEYVEDTKRTAKVNEIAACIDRWLESTRQYHWNFFVRLRQKASRLCFLLNRREGTYLVGLYLIVKVMYAVNVVSQFYLLDAFLGGFFRMWGIEALDNFTVRGQFRESRRFPRVTLCDFKMRQMHNVNTYTVLCVLPMNIFNERIFLFLWFWLIFVAIVTFINLLLWVSRIMCRTNRLVLVKKYLKMHSRLQTEVDKKVCRKFTAFLRDDGVFLIRMMQKNSNEILVSELVSKLWDMFLEKKMVQKLMRDGATNGSTLRSVS